MCTRRGSFKWRNREIALQNCETLMMHFLIPRFFNPAISVARQFCAPGGAGTI